MLTLPFYLYFELKKETFDEEFRKFMENFEKGYNNYFVPEFLFRALIMGYAFKTVPILY